MLLGEYGTSGLVGQLWSSMVTSKPSFPCLFHRTGTSQYISPTHTLLHHLNDLQTFRLPKISNRYRRLRRYHPNMGHALSQGSLHHPRTSQQRVRRSILPLRRVPPLLALCRTTQARTHEWSRPNNDNNRHRHSNSRTDQRLINPCTHRYPHTLRHNRTVLRRYPSPRMAIQTRVVYGQCRVRWGGEAVERG